MDVLYRQCGPQIMKDTVEHKPSHQECGPNSTESNAARTVQTIECEGSRYNKGLKLTVWRLCRAVVVNGTVVLHELHFELCEFAKLLDVSSTGTDVRTIMFVPQTGRFGV